VYEQILVTTGKAQGRAFEVDRYECTRQLSGANVLVIDDTWTGGGHAQSAAWALRKAGAGKLVLITIGRHLKRGWKPVQESDETCGDIFDSLPVPFDWNTCVVHRTDGG
jgi:orotate phosphoribosyltransferase